MNVADSVESLAGRTASSLLSLPESVLKAICGETPVNDRGAPLDLQFHALLKFQQTFDLHSVEDQTPEEARRTFRTAAPIIGVNPPGGVEVEERTIPGSDDSLPVRIYRPPYEATLPGCVYYHGGGFVLGDLDSYDSLCRFLAVHAACVVVSVDYRRAPEHPFPAALEDGDRSFRWVHEHADELNINPTRLAVAGDSAGATISTVIAQQSIVGDTPRPDYQLLLYPITDYPGNYPSREQFADGFFLTRSMMEWFSDLYLQDEDVDPENDPRLSPLRFEHLEEMPPAMVATAGFDPLRDEGEAYAKVLRRKDVRVLHRSFDRFVHGFVNMGGVVDAAGRAFLDIAEEFRRELRR